jgi:hypothetical protein
MEMEVTFVNIIAKSYILYLPSALLASHSIGMLQHLMMQVSMIDGVNQSC